MGSMDKTELAARMKEYERATVYRLPRRTYTIIRVDGRAFHTFTRGMKRPYDEKLMAAMAETMRVMCADELDGCVLGYTQSDEITFVLTDFATPKTQAFFDAKIQKIASIAAAATTMHFNRIFGSDNAMFDARVFSIPDPVEVANNLVWRQQDATRNSVSMAAQAYFSHRELQGVNAAGMQDKLMLEKGVNWNDYPAEFKRGTVCYRDTILKPIEYTRKDTGEHVVGEVKEHNVWLVEGALRFTSDEGWAWLMSRIPRRHSEGVVVS